MLPDRVFYPLMFLVVAGLIALATVYPQGQGDRSWGPFGAEPVLQTSSAQALARHDAKLAAETKQAVQILKAPGDAADVRTAKK